MRGGSLINMKPLTVILATLCLAVSWYYAVSLASMGNVGLKSGQSNDFFLLWNASRAVLHGVDPYSDEIARQNQIEEYGTTAVAVGEQCDYRLVYPIQATFPVLPLAWLDFRFADKIALILMTAVVALSIGWFRGLWDGTTLLYALLAFASYPVIVALQMHQPTLLFFGLMLGSFALLRSRHLILAGCVAALACGKPQIALPVLLPMLIWSLAEWRQRKRFAIALVATVLGLFLLSCVISPGWVPRWLDSLHGYSQYVHPSLVVGFLGAKAGLVVSGMLALGLAAALWLNRDRDLAFQIALSTAVFSLLIQGEFYNMAILLVPAVWVADNVKRLHDSGPVNQIALAFVRIALAEFWLANAVGAVLFHTTPLGKTIAWEISVAMTFPVVGALALMMIVQLLPQSRLLHGPMETIDESALT